MTTLASPMFTRMGRRFRNAWRTLFAPGDWVTLLIAGVLLMLPVLALQTAGWALDMGILLPTALLSVGFGFLLARSQYNELLGLFISVIYGVCFVLVIAAFNQPGNLIEAIYGVFARLARWIYDALSGGINQDDLVFSLLVGSLFWFLGYNLSWHLFRIDRVWRAILPPALILISNQVYYTGTASLDIYLIVFLFLCLLLVVRSNLDAREWDWYLHGIRAPRRLRTQFLFVGAVLALIVMLGAWAIPQRDVQDRLTNFQEFMRAQPLQQLGELWNRLFTSAETVGPATTDYYGGDSLQLGGAIRLGDEVVFLASAPQGRRYYWRSRVFDYYDHGRWSSAADTRLTDPGAPLVVEHEDYVPGARVPVQQTFTIGLNASRLIYTAPQPLQVDLPTRTDLRYTPDQNLVGQNMSISVIRPLQVLYEGESYTASSLMSAATADQLRAAGTDYPAWVREVYSNYIPSAPSSIKTLAEQVVAQAGATTPYDQARAIELFLREYITYNERIPQPPIDRDPIEWVLFELREGYCNYYASAMVVMLRMLGIPARMAAGFAQGEYDGSEGAFVVRERDAHTWVEVYFPGYGWIEFEPTSAEAPINRGDTQQPPVVEPPTLPPPTATPTFTPSPLPTNTPIPSTPDIPEAQQSQTPQLPTPTLTASPTITPVIVPTPPPPTRPTPPNPFSFLLPAIGAVFLGLLLILLIVAVGVFIYWWWEWRGMRGLSPITRAYARLERYLPLVGIRFRGDQTPNERRARVIHDLPAIEPPVTAITRLYVTERYGRRDEDPTLEDTPRAETANRAWTDARGGILSRWLRKLFVPWRRE